MRASLPFRVGVVLTIGIIESISTSPAFADNAEPTVAATSIMRVPVTITKPGLYIVKTNLALTTATGVAITIAANDVTLDLGGHFIANSATTGTSNLSYAVKTTDVHDITVRNGILRNFAVGVAFNQTGAQGRSVVADMVLENIGGNAIFINNAAEAEVCGCQILGTGFLSAIFSVSAINVTADNLKVTGNVIGDSQDLGVHQSDGMVCKATYSGLIGKNVVSSSSQGRYGIFCDTSVGAPIMAVENTIENFQYGLYLNGAAGKYRANLTSSCTTPFTGGTAVGSENN